MIQGIEKFREFFEGFENDYVIIGGLATAMVMNDLGFVFRATKDVDLVVLSTDNEAFLKRILLFIDEAGYQTKQRTKSDTKHNLFRFCDSDDKSYPEQLELFAIHGEDSSIITDNHIIPIETPEFYDYLSAILLDRDYYNLLKQHTTNVDGLHVATAEVLIPLKIHAHLNFIDSVHNYNGKHLKDVVRLCTTLDGEEKVHLTGMPRDDFQKFLPIFNELDEDRVRNILKTNQIGGVTKQDLLSLLKSTYRI
ncbi:MAG: hypothetical protein ACWA5P_03295 [bacterium]